MLVKASIVGVQDRRPSRIRAHLGGELFTVALVGSDGAGKTTIARSLEKTSSLPVKYMYMGLSPISSKGYRFIIGVLTGRHSGSSPNLRIRTSTSIHNAPLLP